MAGSAHRQKQERRYGRRTARPRSAPKGVARQFIYGGLSILFVALIVSGVWYVTRIPFLTVSHIEVSGGQTVSHEEVERKAEEVLSGTRYLIVPKRFTYAYSPEAIVQAVDALPRVRQVTVEKTDLRTISITVEEYAPHALWCEESGVQTEKPEEGARPSCMFLADDGYAFAKAPELQGGVFVRHVVEGASLEEKQLFSLREMSRMDAFLAALRKGLGFRVNSIVHTEAGDEEYRLRSGGVLLVSPDMPPQTVFDNLRSILESPKFAQLASGDFAYIDLRFGNRVFVNENGATEDHIPASNSDTQ